MNASERFCNAYTQNRGRTFGLPDTAQQLGWLRQLKDHALESFSAQGVPGPRVENWKYTRLGHIEQLDYNCTEQHSHSTPEIQAADLPICPDSYQLVFIDGNYTPALSSDGSLPDGLILCSLAQGLIQYPSLLSSTLGTITEYKGHPFAALNGMYMADGVFLRVAKGTKIQAPIHCLFYSTVADKAIMNSPRLLLVIEEQAEVTVIEHYLGCNSTVRQLEHQGDSPHLTNSLTEIALGRQARMQHYKLQSEPMTTSHIAGLHVEQQRDSVFCSHNLSLGASLTRNDICIKLADEGAECHLYGAYCIGGKQHVDSHTQIDHLKPSCRSLEQYKGVIQDRARAVFNGMVVVHADAQHSDAQLINKNLLLSSKAEVDTKPELQIYADDVKCSHGATVGQLDPTALFYLQSRGITSEDAQALLITAFIDEILLSIEQPAVRHFLQPSIQAQLHRLISCTPSSQGKE